MTKEEVKTKEYFVDIWDKILRKIRNRDYAENYTKLHEWEFIWGIKSFDELSPEKPSYWTMNDFDIMYNKNDKYYSYYIETEYVFEKENWGRGKYILGILENFTKYMRDNGLSVNTKLSFAGMQANNKFTSIEELYTAFRLFATNFVN